MIQALDDKLTEFLSKHQFLRFKKGEIIIRAEDSPSGVYYILKGYVRVYCLTPEGNELTLNIFKPASFFPLTWAIADTENVYFYEAMTAVDVYRSPRNDFIDFIKNDKDALFEINKRVLTSLNSLTIRMQYLTLGSAYIRIVNTLLLLARSYGQKIGKGVKIGIPVTQQDIANLANVTRETTSIEIKKLSKSKLIKKDKRFYLIKDLNKLKNEASVYSERVTTPYTF